MFMFGVRPDLRSCRYVLATAIAMAIVCGLPPRARAQSERAPIRNPDLTMRYFVWSYKEIKERLIVMQKYDYSCGAAVLATIIKYYWGDDHVSETTFLDLLPRLKLSEKELKDRIENGLTLTDLRNLARLAGYQGTMAKVTFQELADGKVPVIVGVTVRKHDHFVVVRGADDQFVYLADPIRGNVKTRISAFLEQWQKNAILVIAKPNTPVKKFNRLGIREDEYYRGGVNRQKVRQDNMKPPIPLWAPIGP
jgi:predicted double-glycine peptidase